MIQFSISWNSIQCAASAPSAGRLISAKASHMEGSSEPTMKDGDIGAPALPTEVLTEIFARLPSKSVGRFRCVSHAWCDTLTSPYFVELHYRRANQLVHPRLLLTPVGASYDSHLYSWRLGM
uniref:F-box domain-containing protein n=1 Tax=Setaria italica TaxID=4555 RepID=A0A0Q3QLI0_SETIT